MANVTTDDFAKVEKRFREATSNRDVLGAEVVAAKLVRQAAEQHNWPILDALPYWPPAKQPGFRADQLDDFAWQTTWVEIVGWVKDQPMFRGTSDPLVTHRVAATDSTEIRETRAEDWKARAQNFADVCAWFAGELGQSVAASFWHPSDFRSLRWGDYGTFSFTANQAACVNLLVEAWGNGAPDVGGTTLLEAADSNSDRIDHVFRDCTAWGRIIVSGHTKGAYRLVEPIKGASTAPRKKNRRVGK